MAITLKRQLTEDEKKEIIRVHGRKCFATGHGIQDGEPLHFDHIRAFALGGQSELDNIAPMCETHNLEKGMLPLGDFRVKLRLNDFFSQGESLTLKHLLEYLKRQNDITAFGQSAILTEDTNHIQVEKGSGEKYINTLYTCPITGSKYFYAILPVELLNSDDDDEDNGVGLQPRFLIFDKVFELYRHFQNHPVLQPSVGRVSRQRILMFDGQHKIAALLFNGRKEFECKIYLQPDLRLLNQTNVAAHDKYSQTRFATSIMVIKLGKEFGADFENYKNLEDGAVKSEANFIKFLERDLTQVLTKGERKRRFRSYLFNSILEDSANKLAPFVSTGNRSTDKQPLTIDMLSKSLFACFVYSEPVEEDMATEAYKRDKEITNNVQLMNMLFDLGLGAWNPSAGANDDNQRKLSRLFRSKSIMAWSEILRDAIRPRLGLVDSEDQVRPFYRDLSADQPSEIKKMIERSVNWKFWNSPDGDIDRILSDNKSEVKAWLRNHGLTTGYLMGAPE